MQARAGAVWWEWPRFSQFVLCYFVFIWGINAEDVFIVIWCYSWFYNSLYKLFLLKYSWFAIIYIYAAAAKSLQLCPTVWPHRWQLTRLHRPWDSPGKNTGVGCHFLLQCMKMKSESEVTQSSLTLRDPMDCSPPGSSFHGIFQARVLEWGAIAFSDIYVYT